MSEHSSHSRAAQAPGHDPGRAGGRSRNQSVGRLRHAARLAGLCTALKASADEILGLEKGTKANAKAPDRRFLRRIEKLHQLSRRDQQAILGTIDAFLSKVS